MGRYSQYLFQPGYLNEEAEAKKKKDSEEEDPANKNAAWYNVPHHVGRAVGFLTKHIDQGFEHGYGKSKNYYHAGYSDPKLRVKQESTSNYLFRSPLVEGNDCDTGQCAQALGVGTGTAFNNANKLWNVPTNIYDNKFDAQFIGPGDEYSNARNEPALRAARIAGGRPDPKTVSNGINSTAPSGLFKINRSLQDDFGANG